jgi:hypothetical protein
MYKYNNVPFYHNRFGKGEHCSITLLDQEYFLLLKIQTIRKNRMDFIILDKNGITCLRNMDIDDSKFFEEVD